jgi:hypothetical protein
MIKAERDISEDRLEETNKIQTANKEIDALNGQCAAKEAEILKEGGKVPEEVNVLQGQMQQIDLSKALMKTGHTEIDKTVEVISDKTQNYRLANVWARLLGKFGEKYGDIVESVVAGVDGTIVINFKDNPGRAPEEQYKMWIPVSPDEHGVIEPEGGVIIMLGRQVVMKAAQDMLEVKEGYQNYVRLPAWVPYFIKKMFGEFTSGNTIEMKVHDGDKIDIAVYKKGITKVRTTPHKVIDHNWKVRGEVIDDSRPNAQVIREHDDNYTADEVE